jgi:hypothetical protein
MVSLFLNISDGKDVTVVILFNNVSDCTIKITVVSLFLNNMSDGKDVTTVIILFNNDVSDCTITML